MIQKEINELRRRFRADQSAISRIYGCYVNTNKEIVSYLDTSLGMLPEEEAELYLGRLKKALSGTLGKNLVDIVFSTQQVMDSEEHRLLTTLRESQLKDGKAREEFYRRVIEALELEGTNYLILLAADQYDVPRRGKDDRKLEDGSETVFSYIVCAVCPVKDSSPELRYFLGENEFHSGAIGQVVGSTALGFLFPAFDDRAANIYNALYYTQKPADLHHDFIDAVFKVEPPMSAEEQREAFHSILTGELGEQCGYELLQNLHERLSEQLREHRSSKAPEPLSVTVGELGEMLRDNGLEEEKIAAFTRACSESFGEGAVLDPANLIDAKKFEVSTPEWKLSVNPESSYLLEARVIDGRPYLLIPAGQGVELNGVETRVAPPAPEEASEEGLENP